MEEKQILRIIDNYLKSNFTLEIKNKNKEELKNVLKNEHLAREILIKGLDNNAFACIEKELNLDKSYREEREGYEKNIVNNFSEHSLESVQQALCDIFFHDNKHNVQIRIRELKERAKYDEEFCIIEQKYDKVFTKFLEFLNLNQDNVTQEQLEVTLNQISSMNYELKLGNDNLLKAINMLNKTAKDGFRTELQSKMKESKEKMFVGVEPTIIETPDGKTVKLYKMQNQGENQSEFVVLTRTNYVKPYMMEEGAKEKYSEEASSKNYYSYSVRNQSINSGFVQESRVTFGFFSLENSEIMSCTTHDGQSNQITLTDTRKHIIKQELLPINEFLLKTGKYNEVVLTNPESIVPEFIYSYEEIPSEEVVKIASAMGIPILYVDGTKYEKHVPDKRVYYLEDWYDYFNKYLKERLAEIDNPQSGG